MKAVFYDVDVFELVDGGLLLVKGGARRLTRAEVTKLIGRIAHRPLVIVRPESDYRSPPSRHRTRRVAPQPKARPALELAESSWME